MREPTVVVMNYMVWNCSAEVIGSDLDLFARDTVSRSLYANSRYMRLVDRVMLDWCSMSTTTATFSLRDSWSVSDASWAKEGTGHNDCSCCTCVNE